MDLLFNIISSIVFSVCAVCGFMFLLASVVIALVSSPLFLLIYLKQILNTALKKPDHSKFKYELSDLNFTEKQIRRPSANNKKLQIEAAST